MYVVLDAEEADTGCLKNACVEHKYDQALFSCFFPPCAYIGITKTSPLLLGQRVLFFCVAAIKRNSDELHTQECNQMISMLCRLTSAVECS